MSYAREREDFLVWMTREGLPLHVARLLLREATGFNRRAELACSSEAADRDRVPCPAAKRKGPCLCDSADQHEKVLPAGWLPGVPRIAVQDWHAETRIELALKAVNDELYAGRDWRAEELPIWIRETAGDPRGYTLRVIPPSYAARNEGRDRHNRESIGVPPGPSRLRW